MADVNSIYNTASKVVDYYGNASSSSPDGYNEYFSPNNIRRLIISPDVVASEFYISVPNVGHGKRVRISAPMLMMCEQQEGYKPIIQIISGERVCSSIEEIIFLTQSNDGRNSLGYQEYELSSMLRGYNRKEADLKETVKKRFVRLRYFVIADMSYERFSHIERQKGVAIAELPEIKQTANITVLHDEPDWYRHWGSVGATSTYPMMDGVGGHLYNWFKKYIENYEARLKNAELDKFKKEKHGADEEAFKTAFEQYKQVNRCLSKVNKLFSDGRAAGVEKVAVEQGRMELMKHEICKGYPFLIEGTGDVLKENKARCETAMRNQVLALSDTLGAKLVQLGGLSAKVMLHDCETSIIPSGQYTEALNSLGYQMDGKNIKRSVINSCWLLCKFFLYREDGNKKYTKRETWEEVFG